MNDRPSSLLRTLVSLMLACGVLAGCNAPGLSVKSVLVGDVVLDVRPWTTSTLSLELNSANRRIVHLEAGDLGSLYTYYFKRVSPDENGSLDYPLATGMNYRLEFRHVASSGEEQCWIDVSGGSDPVQLRMATTSRRAEDLYAKKKRRGAEGWIYVALNQQSSARLKLRTSS